MDTATKTGTNAEKTASERIVQKNTEATGDLIGNKIADKITSIAKKKVNKKQMNQIKDKNCIYYQKERQ